ncbi:hypothetical protein [Yeosuana marina]|uniref:hypothetical protein n=1 Tax=Yeosuana marina TaxID=1565536 RepID=UPI0030ECB458|tara:strand:- start:713 stop:1243 length:531 start_codon:yes stop_codon:yes gene_type:complete
MKNNLNVNLCIFLFVSCISIFFGNQSFAQEKGIYEVSNNSTLNKVNNQKNQQSTSNNRDNFYDLAFKMYPTHYFEKGTLKSVYKSSDPVKLTFEDSESLKSLNKSNSKNNQVELITIILNSSNDLSNSIDLTSNTDLNKLKYVFVKCNFNCSENQIQKFIKTNAEIRIFYSSQNPS